MNLLFIGTPPDSILAMAKARSLGYGVYGIDGNPHSPGLSWVRKWGCDGCQVDIYDFHQIHQTVLRNDWHIDGVVAVGTDIGPVVSLVAQALSLPHISYHTAKLSWDKPALKQALSKAGIAVPGYADFVIKPPDGRGSRGVSLVSASRLWGVEWDQARQASPTGRVMAEQWIDGPGVSAECVVWGEDGGKGKVIFCGFTDRLYDPAISRTVEIGGNSPSIWHSKRKEELEDVVCRVVGALEIFRGTIKLDIILDKNNDYRPTILEVAINRLSGGLTCSLYLPITYNVDFLAMAFAVATGQKPVVQPLNPKRNYPLFVTGRYDMSTNPTSNRERGKHYFAITKTREEGIVRVNSWLKKRNGL